MATYIGYSTMNFKSGTTTNGQFPSKHTGVIVAEDTNTYTFNITAPFSTIVQLENPGSNTFKLIDIHLVERNLLNHIFTSKGSRRMMGKFGTSIPDLLFEPLTEDAIESIRSDLNSVVEYDPRVKLQSLTITPDYDNHTIACNMTLYYIELNMSNRLSLNLEFTS
jgi:phage baseplate assembly protein W